MAYHNGAIYLPIQQEPQTRDLEGYGSGSEYPPTPQRLIPMENGQQEVQPRFTLGRTWGSLLGNMFQIDTFQRPYDNHKRLKSQQQLHTPVVRSIQDKGE
ncbi:hypothetical protein O181_075673 [Austropuccinia psidii MF-1]|uniref:Uncharacterized protein n=1 Tax=Austropuccinia psidii MF-1 TaxID=1389203 RepID=A0A9Q3IC38_9BASI|nr:hypothetical protein [Austropuccinia psidii MF-1]